MWDWWKPVLWAREEDRNLIRKLKLEREPVTQTERDWERQKERERGRQKRIVVPFCSILYQSCQEFFSIGRFSDKTRDFFLASDSHRENFFSPKIVFLEFFSLQPSPSSSTFIGTIEYSATNNNKPTFRMKISCYPRISAERAPQPKCLEYSWFEAKVLLGLKKTLFSESQIFDILNRT